MSISVHVRTVTLALSATFILQPKPIDFEGKIKQALYFKKYTPKLNNQKSVWFLIFCKYFLKRIIT